MLIRFLCQLMTLMLVSLRVWLTFLLRIGRLRLLIFLMQVLSDLFLTMYKDSHMYSADPRAADCLGADPDAVQTQAVDCLQILLLLILI